LKFQVSKSPACGTLQPHGLNAVGITPQNLSILKTGKARAIRFSTLEAICETLECQPAEILEFRPESAKKKPVART
jgi:DNA-binding Xre family transcriptional regulator